MAYQDINAETIDKWIREGWEWGKPISHETYEKAKNGTWDVFLTPTKPVPHAWLGELTGKRILGLASGGGQQMPIFAALGAFFVRPFAAGPSRFRRQGSTGSSGMVIWLAL